MKTQLDEFLGSRTLSNDLEQFLCSLKKPYLKPLYRGMNFPIHVLKIGEIVEEWHGSSHWSKEFQVALNFAYDGYLNEEYIEELQEDEALLEEYEVEEAMDLFKEVVFRLSESTQAIDVDTLVNEWELSRWKHEKEVTFIGTEFEITAIKYIEDKEKPYYLVDVKEL